MQTFDIPCNQCEAKTAEFRQRGYTVHGCAPIPGQAGMCQLRYERVLSATPALASAAQPAAAPADATKAAALKAGAPTPSASTATGAPALTTTQAQTCKAIVNLFETSRVLGDYGSVTVLVGDTGRLTYGRSQTTLASGNLLTLLQRYCQNPGAQFGARIAALLPDFQSKANSLDHDVKVHNLLRAAADDRVMRDTQDQFFDETYWAPAVRQAAKLGLRTPLSLAVLYDSQVHGSLHLIRDATTAQLGTPTQAGEAAWVTEYVARRREWLANHSNKLLRQTVYRMDAFQRMLENGNWGLALPLVVRGQEISATALNATPAGCYDGPQPGTRVLGLTQPLSRGLDVRLVQLGLSDRGMNIVADGVFGSASSERIREFQILQGLPATGVADAGLIAVLT